MSILNEYILPNPFKVVPGGELDNVLDNVLASIERELLERDIAHDTGPLPAFLNEEFLARLQAELDAANTNAAHKMQGRRIVRRLRSQLFGQ